MQRHIHETTVSICGFRSVILAAGVAAQDQDKPATPAEQHQALLKELQGSAAAYFQTTNATEQKAIVARVDKATVKLLELIEQYPKEPFAVAALTQIITQEYCLNTHTSHPGCCFATISTAIRSSRRASWVNFGFRQECETFLP